MPWIKALPGWTVFNRICGNKENDGKNDFHYILLISTFCFLMYSIYYKTAHIYATFFKTILLFGSIFVVLDMCLSLECQFLEVRSLLMLPPDSKHDDRELTSFCFVWHTWNVTDETLNLCLFDRWKSIKKWCFSAFELWSVTFLLAQIVYIYVAETYSPS